MAYEKTVTFICVKNNKSKFTVTCVILDYTCYLHALASFRTSLLVVKESNLTIDIALEG